MTGIQKVIGLMSGTSLDGVDAALLDTDGEEVVVPGPSLTMTYAAETRAVLRRSLADRRAGPRRCGAAGFPRPDHPAPARTALDLADRRRRTAGAADRDRCGQ